MKLGVSARSFRPRTGILPVLLLLVRGHHSDAQLVRSWLPWRTVETAHFALHYPTPLEAWTLDLATRIEGIDSAVARLVGYAPTGKTDVVVDDPYELSNGSAWPYLRRPIINLWATPPDPRDDIGEYTRWNDMVASHEFAHVAHLARPSRNSLTRLIWQILPVDLGPVSIKAPRWAFEGYATFVEGRVTGSGRPHGSWRPAFLRQWALEGQLPRYEQLDAWGAYEGGSFAYLAGSAFLEWLVAKRGDSSLVHVWRRMSAKQDRSFDEAFVGVFGESPRALYGRFTAELTANAFAVERDVRAAGDTGTIVQRTSWSTGDPSISPDGQRVALVLRSATQPSRVVIWKTAPEPDTGRARRDSLLLRRDPEDVPARALYPPPKKAIATLRSSGGAPFESPRFFRDGRVLLWRRVARGDGTLTSDLYVWNPGRGRAQRVTHNASLREGDPSPDGKNAVAMQCRSGWCDVVLVDLASGRTRTVLQGSPSRTFFKPRFSPDGRSGVVSATIDGRWQLLLFAIDGSASETRTIGPSDSANRYDASFLALDTIVAVSERGGVPNIERFAISTGESRALTHVTGAAVAPVYNSADRSVWFLSLYSRGYDVRRVRSDSIPASIVVADADLFGVTQDSPRGIPRRPTNSVSDPRRFGAGPRLFRWVPQPQVDADGAAIALGLSSVDIIGRSQALVTVATGNSAAWRGGAAAFVWRGRRPRTRAAAFFAEQTPSASRARLLVPSALDSRLTGADLAVDQSFAHETWSFGYRIAGTAGTLENTSAADPGETSSVRSLMAAEWIASHTWRGNVSSFSGFVGTTFAGGTSSKVHFARSTATTGVALAARGFPSLSASALGGIVNSNAGVFEQFAIGGGPSPLVDRVLLTQRIAMPVLPTGTSVGAQTLTGRVALGAQPISLYLWSGSAAARGERLTTWHRVLGAEWVQSIDPMALAGTPAARVQLGVGRSLDEPFRGKTRGYVNLILNP